MDLISLGLTPTTKKSNKIIKVINNNNRISISIKQEFELLNNFTKQFLTSQYETNQSNQNEQLQQLFKEWYYLFDCENFRINKISNLNLDKLIKLYDSINKLEVNDQNDKQLIELINKYMILAITLNLSNSLIYKTLILKNQQVYWESIYNSTSNKLIYFIQTFPVKLYRLSSSVIERTKYKLESNFNAQGTSDGNLFSKTKNISIALIKSFKNIVENLFVQENPSITFLSKTNKFTISSINWYLKSIFKSPITIIDKEVKSNLKLIKHEIEINTRNIDILIKSDIKDLVPSLIKILELDNEGINLIVQATDSIIKFDKFKNYTSTSQPSFITRYWVILLLLIKYGPSQSINIYNNRNEIIEWIKYNGIEPIKGFIQNWVIKPINEILNILRSDDEISITTKDSLKSDITSLENMIYEFAQDNKIETTPETISKNVNDGNLQIIMSRYENEIRSPIKYIISGSLLRLILIQIQKGKVDGAVAINGIDKLLKSQQLVFGIVSMSPSIIILYQIYKYFTSSKKIVVNGKQLNLICLKSLNNIENLLIQLKNKTITNGESIEGELLIEIINLIVSSKPIIPKELFDDWIRDLNELNNSDYDISTKLDLVQNIWNMYGPIFR
ncbi:unnamed protein product [Candida verbasci]|uniref:Nuclear control of ATPase protein 2 n=1 Tax=Candida verbasci TaxID=1227364 RepID=A0A9W4TZY6_9ASCO|nr:unnamed protein product [Candida verbasci]